jgi:hypothetical protein
MKGDGFVHPVARCILGSAMSVPLEAGGAQERERFELAGGQRQPLGSWVVV